MDKEVKYTKDIKVYYAHMFGSERNTHTHKEIDDLIKQWPENKLMLQYGFGWKGARPVCVKSREEAVNYGWDDAETDNNGNLILTKYGENDYW